MQPTQELVDDIYRDKVRAARAASVDDKLWSGEELFHYAARITMAGIRHENPEADEAEVLRILKQRLVLREQMERHRA